MSDCQPPRRASTPSPSPVPSPREGAGRRQGSRRRTGGAGKDKDRARALAQRGEGEAGHFAGGKAGIGTPAGEAGEGDAGRLGAGAAGAVAVAPRRSKAAARLQQASKKIQAARGFVNEGKSARCGWLLTRQGLRGNARPARSDFVLGRVLGTGVSGVVLLARLRAGGEGFGYCAIKQVRRAGLRKQKHCDRVLAERAALRAVAEQPFFVQLLATFQDDDALYFALQYGVGGELFGRMQQLECLPQAHALFYAAEVLCALKFLHARDLMYRDLKPENALLDAEGHVLLCDFGFTKRPDASGHCFSQIGTPQYLSPELLNGKGKVGYSNAVDWWAWACMLFEMIAGHTPFFRSHDDSHFEVYLRAMKGSVSWPR